MATKRRLEDLFVIGKDLEFDDGATEEVDDPSKPGQKIKVPAPPVEVYLRKLNPVESGQAVRKASAARARTRAARRDREGDLYQELLLDVDEMDRDALVDYVAMDKLAEVTIKTEAKLAAEEEWSKDDYLQGLRDAWQDGLRDAYAADPEDVEAKRVFEELKRFDQTAMDAAEEERSTLHAEWEEVSEDDLRDKAIDIMLRFRATQAWMDEFHRCELWLGVFEMDRKTRYFEKREQVDQLSVEVLTKLFSEYEELSVDVLEGKDSEETPDSSPSSAPPAAEETGASSGLEAVTQ